MLFKKMNCLFNMGVSQSTRSVICNKNALFKCSILVPVRKQSIINNTYLLPAEETVTQTVKDVRKKFMQIMGLEPGFRTIKKSRAHLLKYLPASQDELPTRSMQDSFQSAIIPLSTNVSLQEKYVTVLGNVRLGRLMEDMDIFAAWSAIKYIDNPKQQPENPTPYVIVTVLVDQISFTDFVAKPDEDIRILGHVSHVGTSSMEVSVWLEQYQHGIWQKLTNAIFLMAARNATNTNAAPVNKLVPANDTEKQIWKEAEERKKRRQKEVKGSLLATLPTPDEQQIIHDLFVSSIDLKNPTLNKRMLPPGSVWMSDTQQANIIFSHPEDRNLHNKVFGGFLMRMALELAWIVAHQHSKRRPKLMHISDISFKKPVDVGSLLGMRSQVIYTEHNYMQVVVHAEVCDAFTGQTSTTNMFHYTYESPEPVLPVVPNTYQEVMLYIDGRRHFQEVMGLVE